jgi:hypothetical protein
VPTSPDQVRALFNDTELAEFAARPVRLGADRSLDALELTASWASRVEKIDRDRNLPWADRTVWNEHDLAGSLFVRDFLQEAIDGLPAPLQERLAAIVGTSDQRFRSYTVEDPVGRMGRVADVDLAGRGWWWSRVPGTGPIAQDLARYWPDYGSDL